MTHSPGGAGCINGTATPTPPEGRDYTVITSPCEIDHGLNLACKSGARISICLAMFNTLDDLFPGQMFFSIVGVHYFVEEFMGS